MFAWSITASCRTFLDWIARILACGQYSSRYKQPWLAKSLMGQDRAANGARLALPQSDTYTLA